MHLNQISLELIDVRCCTYTNPVIGSIVRHGVTLLHANAVSQLKRYSQFSSPKYSGCPNWKQMRKKGISVSRRDNLIMALNWIYLYRFIANEVNDGRDICIFVRAFFVRCEIHEKFAIFKSWIWNSVAIICESFFHIHFVGVVQANATLRWTHFIVTIQRWLAYIDQKFHIAFERDLMIVVTQWHQIEFMIVLRILSYAPIRIQCSWQRMTHRTSFPHQYKSALVIGLLKRERERQKGGEKSIFAIHNRKMTKKDCPLTYGMKIIGVRVWDE